MTRWRTLNKRKVKKRQGHAKDSPPLFIVVRCDVSQAMFSLEKMAVLLTRYAHSFGVQDTKWPEVIDG